MSMVQNWGDFWLGFTVGFAALFLFGLILGLIYLRLHNDREYKARESLKKTADRERFQRLSTQFNLGGRIANTLEEFIADQKLNHQISVSRINKENLGFHIMVAWSGTKESSYRWGGVDYSGMPIFHAGVILDPPAKIEAQSEELGVFYSGASDEEADAFVAQAETWVLDFASRHQLDAQ